MAAIAAARSDASLRVIAIDGARTLGAKILVAGGGRCNVTHFEVDERAYAGSTRPAIRKVLLQFPVAATETFFHELGVELKREETGKLFPTTDKARTVLDALLRAAREAGVELRHPWRVHEIIKAGDAFSITGDMGSLRAKRVVLATGGCSLPKSGSDGAGLEMVRGLGHTLTDRIFPALVPLLLETSHPLTTLSGISAPARLEVRASSGRKLILFTGDVLCTHFGLSGPAVLDISRYYLDAAAIDPGAMLVIGWLPDFDETGLSDALLASGHTTVARFLRDRLPERLARLLHSEADIDAALTCAQLTRPQRRSLSELATAWRLPIVGERGFTHAEVTAGGVPLNQIRLDTMESRVCPGLYLCGEICDVDGRIGGFNFQWAWASGHVAGRGASRSVAATARQDEQ